MLHTRQTYSLRQLSRCHMLPEANVPSFNSLSNSLFSNLSNNLFSSLSNNLFSNLSNNLFSSLSNSLLCSSQYSRIPLM